MTAVLARGARHSLAVALAALVIAAFAAFLPLGASDASDDGKTASALASNLLEDSIDLETDVFAISATVLTNRARQAVGASTPTPFPALLVPIETVTAEAVGAAPGPTLGPTPAPTPIATTAPAVTRQFATPVQTPAESSRVYSSALASVQSALAESPWPPELWPTVERIIQCESSGNPAAIGPGGYRGLMQVDPRLHGPVPGDAVGQLTQAYDVYLRQGWGAWGCY